jgi:cyclic pyranopterin phosphate synthase
VRLTARGVLALCLGQEDSVDLRTPIRDGISDDELKQLIVKAMEKKPERHFFNENVHNIEFRQMVSLGG